MKFGVIIFPGSNCDHDAYWAFKEVCGQPATMLWHDSHDLENSDVIIVPGGFSYGDYLRTGAIARFSPIMQSVKRFADSGGLVMGICNGFQILCEAHLLPGVLLRNKSLKYICKPVHLRVENTKTPFTQALTQGEVLEIPIGHGDGNYFCDEPTLQQLHQREQVIFRYATPQGEITRRGESQWLAGKHCRHLQRRAQRPGNDAASGARQRRRTRHEGRTQTATLVG